MVEKQMMAGGFRDWLAQASPGERVIYYVGECAGGSDCRAAMAAEEQGLVLLMQRRIVSEKSSFQYIAQRKRS